MRRVILISAVTAVLALSGAFLITDSPWAPGTGQPQLVSIQQLPDYGELCTWGDGPSSSVSFSSEDNLFSAFEGASAHAAAEGDGQMADITRPPVRTIRDTYPTYSFVAVDVQHDEVVLQDNNLWSIRVFNRLENSPPGGPLSVPKRIIEGPKTEIQFNNGMYIDPKNGDIYSVESDTGDKVVVFDRTKQGDVEPNRILNVPHRGFALAVKESTQELYVGVQYPPQIPVYRKTASGDDEPVRNLRGESTRLSDTHGVALDEKRNLMFVNNWGHVSDYKTAGTGRFEDPSISVYSLDASGDAPPLRVIQGPKTQLNWPAAMSLDPETGDLYVANDVGQSILVFRETDKGNVAPSRVIKGDKTGLRYPAGVFVDTKHKEVWAANFGSATATVYPMTANGNVAPLRTIRSAPTGYEGLKFGKIEAVAYDSKREEYLVPN
jgi:6-phosphogluconolactonase (cycloisomerase 2 family)